MKEDIDFMNTQMVRIDNEIENYLKQIHAVAVRERKRVKIKMQGARRFVMSHVTNVL